jgi:hypothetical protein
MLGAPVNLNNYVVNVQNKQSSVLIPQFQCIGSHIEEIKNEVIPELEDIAEQPPRRSVNVKQKDNHLQSSIERGPRNYPSGEQPVFRNEIRVQKTNEE